jgi:hypothetical protein
MQNRKIKQKSRLRQLWTLSEGYHRMKINLKALKRALILTSPYWFLTIFISARVVLEHRIDFIYPAGFCIVIGGFWAYGAYLLECGKNI